MCKWNPKSRNKRVDPCMRPLIRFANNHDYDIVACCCGHGKYPITMIRKYKSLFDNKMRYEELFSGKDIKRSRRFYKRDKDGMFYIPELEKRKT